MVKGVPSAPKYEVPEEIKEKARGLIKDFMKENNITAPKLAEKLQEVYGRSSSRTNILNKLARSSFSLTEFIQIIEAYGYELEIKQTDSTNRNILKSDNA